MLLNLTKSQGKLPQVILICETVPEGWQKGPWSWGWLQWSARGPGSRTRLQTGSSSRCGAPRAAVPGGHPGESAPPACPERSARTGAERKEQTHHAKWGGFPQKAAGIWISPTNIQTRCFYLWLQLICTNITRARSQQNKGARNLSFPSTQRNKDTQGASPTHLICLQLLTEPPGTAKLGGAGGTEEGVKSTPAGNSNAGHVSSWSHVSPPEALCRAQKHHALCQVPPVCSEGPSRLCTKGKGLQWPELSSQTCLLTHTAPDLWTHQSCHEATLYQLHEVIYGQHHSITRRGVHQFAQKMGNSTQLQDLKEKSQQKPTAMVERQLP